MSARSLRSNSTISQSDIDKIREEAYAKKPRKTTNPKKTIRTDKTQQGGLSVASPSPDLISFNNINISISRTGPSNPTISAMVVPPYQGYGDGSWKNPAIALGTSCPLLLFGNATSAPFDKEDTDEMRPIRCAVTVGICSYRTSIGEVVYTPKVQLALETACPAILGQLMMTEAVANETIKKFLEHEFDTASTTMKSSLITALGAANTLTGAGFSTAAGAVMAWYRMKHDSAYDATSKSNKIVPVIADTMNLARSLAVVAIASQGHINSNRLQRLVTATSPLVPSIGQITTNEVSTVWGIVRPFFSSAYAKQFHDETSVALATIPNSAGLVATLATMANTGFSTMIMVYEKLRIIPVPEDFYNAHDFASEVAKLKDAYKALQKDKYLAFDNTATKVTLREYPNLVYLVARYIKEVENDLTASQNRALSSAKPTKQTDLDALVGWIKSRPSTYNFQNAGTQSIKHYA